MSGFARRTFYVFMINVDVNIAKSSAERKVSQSFIRKVARKTLFLSGKKINQLSLSIVLVGEKKIRALNRIYRKKNKPTDILSFNYSSGYNKKGVEGLPASRQKREALLAGELVLCPDVIAKNARENKVDFSRELAFVLAHGVLHILGWRHGKKMFDLQDKVVQSLRITNLYEYTNT